MNELLASFVTEARDLLAEAAEDLLALERTPDDEAAINRLFRSVHTLKGSSGLFDVAPLTRILHAAEDMFQAVREQGVALSAEMVDVALRTLDQTGLWIDALERNQTLPDTAAAASQTLAATLRAAFGSVATGGAAATAASLDTAPEAGAAAELLACFDATLRRLLSRESGSFRLITYEPDEACFFKGEDPLHLALQIPGMAALASTARSPWQTPDALDPFMCNLRFHALSRADHDTLEALFRYVPEQVTILDIPAAALLHAIPAGAAPATPAANPLTGELLSAQLALLDAPAPEAERAGRWAAAADVARHVLQADGHNAAAASVAAAHAEAEAACLPGRLRSAIADALANLAAVVPALAAAPAMPGRDAQARPAAEPPERTAPRTLRIDQEKIDQMMNLVGELIVAKNSLPFLARRAEQQFGQRELGREIQDQYSVIDRIAQELQGSVMAVRMMPMGQVFQRFPRLVRDLARKLGKQVELVIEGEQTEADKNVIETLFDPLLHMVRNCLDHAVEPPAERIALGKPETAIVKLAARQDSDQVVIEIIDDGRGLDPEKLKRKAYERGLIDEDRLAAMSDHEARMLIFAAGFSTAATISDVSGRGVGMDVVRNAVEKAGGRVALSSELGRGTTVRLNLPLSMAVTRVMTVTLHERLFGIPMDLIRETVRVPAADILRIKSSEAFLLRDRVVPLLRLASLLEMTEPEAAGDDVAVLVVRVGGQTIGLGITAFGEGMEVILKPLAGMLAALGGYAGTALLGDGRVLLVLDLKELIAT